MSAAIRVGMHGAGGRMGQSILRELLSRANTSTAPHLQLSAAFEHDTHAQLGRDVSALFGGRETGVRLETVTPVALERVDVVIDFSTPAGTTQIARACAVAGRALVVGTTGLDSACHEALRDLSGKAAVVVAPNMSIGVNVLFHLAAEAARLLGPSYDIEIVEMHHRNKVDAPSGTAIGLYQSVTAARTSDFADSTGAAHAQTDVALHGRSGQVGARKQGEIGVMALRGGDVVGDHTVMYAGDGERIELTHRAHTREIFAEGAIRAAAWAARREPGNYTIKQVLGIDP